MEATICAKPGPPDGLQLKEVAENNAAFAELGRGVQAALETYSNIHRGSGHNSLTRGGR